MLTCLRNARLEWNGDFMPTAYTGTVAASTVSKRGGSASQGLHQSRSIRAAQTGTGVPTGLRCVFMQCAVDVVVALDDVMKQFWRIVEERIDEPDGVFAMARQPLIDARNQAGPQGRDRAGPADDRVLPRDPHLITGERVGVTGHIRQTSSRCAPGRFRYPEFALVRWTRENPADSPATGAATVAFIPNDFASDGGSGTLQPGAATRQDKGTGR